MTSMFKPLVWNMATGTPFWTSNDYLTQMVYQVWEDATEWVLAPTKVASSRHATRTLAFDAAQADYEARIMAAMDPAFLARLAALEAQVKAAEGLAQALAPFNAAVFNDNGDVAVSTGHITTGAWLVMVRRLAAYRAAKEEGDA
jgi:hypothetical protein